MSQRDYNMLLQDASFRLYSSQIGRQASACTSNIGINGKRGWSRVTKPSNTNDSPHCVQRRTTTANHTTRPSPHKAQEQRPRSNYNLRHSLSSSRPMTWHPGSDSIGLYPQQRFSSNFVTGNKVENLTHPATPTSTIQQSLQEAIAVGYGDLSSIVRWSCGLRPSETDFIARDNNGSAHDGLSAKSLADRSNSQRGPEAFGFNSFMCQSNQIQPSFHPSRYSDSCITHGLMTVRETTTSGYEVSAQPCLQATAKETKELVGMGLYDDKDGDFLSSLNYAVTSDLTRMPVGKGLKLEETWEPPKSLDEKDEEEDEGYSTDEGEDVDTISPIPPSSPQEPPTLLHTVYSDMANQSFFLADDDTLTSESNYGDYLLDQYYHDTAAAGPPKTADPTIQNFSWI